MAPSPSVAVLQASRGNDPEGGIEMQRTEIPTATIEEPGFARWLFASRSAAWIWLVARVWLGWQWFTAGWDKVTGTTATGFFNWHLHWGFTDQSWLRDGGAALKGFAGYA